MRQAESYTYHNRKMVSDFSEILFTKQGEYLKIEESRKKIVNRR
jgi:hypothetical protein